MSKENEIGALWERKSSDGKEFMTGTINLGETVMEIVVFKNGFKKEGEKTPDWRIYKSRPKPEVADGPVAEDEGASSIPF
jgi:uncharacterized protein (DUF736 family)